MQEISHILKYLQYRNFKFCTYGIYIIRKNFGMHLINYKTFKKICIEL